MAGRRGQHPDLRRRAAAGHPAARQARPPVGASPTSPHHIPNPHHTPFPPLRRLSEVDAGWALAVAGLGIFIVFALCIMAKCKLSLFTR